MKIISKYKDYYDYMAHKYGMDPKVTIDRTEGFIPNISKPDKQEVLHAVQLAICGELHSGLIDHEGNFHWGEDAISLGELKTRGWLDDGKEMLYFESGWNRTEKINPKPVATELNDKHQCPIVWVAHGYGEGDKWPKLADIGLPGYIEPEDMFNRIYSWVSANNEPDTTDTRDDKTKTLNAGFDLKKSFRHRK